MPRLSLLAKILDLLGCSCNRSPVLRMLLCIVPGLSTLVGTEHGRQAARGLLLQQHLLDRVQRVHAVHHIVPRSHIHSPLRLFLLSHNLQQKLMLQSLAEICG